MLLELFLFRPPRRKALKEKKNKKNEQNKSFMLLLFKKKRINGINKCPILGIEIYSGVELFNAVYFFFLWESSSVCKANIYFVRGVWGR